MLTHDSKQIKIKMKHSLSLTAEQWMLIERVLDDRILFTSDDCPNSIHAQLIQLQPTIEKFVTSLYDL